VGFWLRIVAVVVVIVVDDVDDDGVDVGEFLNV